MKKRISVLLICLVLLAAFPNMTFASAIDDPVDHEHVYDFHFYTSRSVCCGCIYHEYTCTICNSFSTLKRVRVWTCDEHSDGSGAVFDDYPPF